MKRKVLLVDDEPVILEVVSIAMGGNNRYELLLAEDGNDALRIAKESHPDLVIMDVSMPVLDGLEACKKLKADPATSGIPVILLTAMAQRLDIERGTAAGADDYIVKPFSPSALLTRIEEVFASMYSTGQEVRLKDGRVGTVQRRIMMDLHSTRVVGYHVAVETGTTATVPAVELELIA